MEARLQKIIETLSSFLKEDADEVIGFMESMLYDWYQHYAQDHYTIDHINEVVNSTFKVNDLLLKLHDAMLSLKEEEGGIGDNLLKDSFEFKYAG